jgi:hypothetical protein
MPPMWSFFLVVTLKELDCCWVSLLSRSSWRFWGNFRGDRSGFGFWSRGLYFFFHGIYV